MTRRRASVFFAFLAMAFIACGGDDGGGDAAGDAPSGAASEASPDGADDDAVAAVPAACPTSVPYDVEVRLDGDGEREPMTVVDAVALRRSEGRAWTVYLADFDMPDDTSWSFTVPEVPAGNMLVSTGLDVFNATDVEALPIIEVGATGGLFRDVGDGETATYLNVTSETTGSSSVNQTGSTELLHLDDGLICFDTEITGESGLELVGTYAATEIVDI